ncbi:adenosine receptor A2b-like [Anneissia japonica]|uniref:adenosine receptor A2b-like n=1 Tax=Anneissia japonica TaxID=1529436 RepID=UPI001425A7EF|nr:adenosine receptor A2b-like [Anneissia japonica]
MARSLSLTLFIFIWFPLMLMTIIGNFIVMLTVFRKRSLVKTPNNIFVSSLALFDFLTGLIGLPVLMAPLYEGHCEEIWYSIAPIIIIPVSVLNLSVMTFDRFLAIKYPLRHHVWMSPERAIRIIIIVDACGVFYGGSPVVVAAVASLFVPLSNVTFEYMALEYDCGMAAHVATYGRTVSDYITFQFFCLTFPMMFMVYAYVYFIASKKGKENATHQGKNIRRREMKVTKTTAIVLLSYTLCIAPISLRPIVMAYVNSPTWLLIYKWSSKFLIFANSMMNPLVYAGRSKEMRKEFKETFKFIICKVSSGSRNAISQTQSPTRRQSPKGDLVTSSTNLAARFTTSFDNTCDVPVQVL